MFYAGFCLNRKVYYIEINVVIFVLLGFMFPFIVRKVRILFCCSYMIQFYLQFQDDLD